MIQKFTKLWALTFFISFAFIGTWSGLSAQTFSNPATITINTVGPSTPSPSVINVTGGPSSIAVVSVTLNNVSHTWQNDIDILLVAPNGESLVLMSDAGPDFGSFTAQTFIVADFAGVPFQELALNTAGSYRPTNYGTGDLFTNFVGIVGNSAPAGTATFSSVFGGDNANGNWSLFIQDDVGGDAGSVAGWSITFAGAINGCTDANACNYNPAATANDGTCIFPGCTDNGAVNYDPAAGCDDGSCCFSNIVTLNMFDDFAGWQGAVATITDAFSGASFGTATLPGGTLGSAEFCLPDGCYFIEVIAGTWPTEVSWEIVTAAGVVAEGGAPSNVLFTVGSADCVLGCTNNGATNYNPSATVDNGTCLFCSPGQQVLQINMFDSFGDGWNGAQYFILNSANQTVASGDLDGALAGNGVTEGFDVVCLPAGCYNISVTGGQYPTEVSWSLTDVSGNIVAQGDNPDASLVAFPWAGAQGCVVPGCQDPNCNNYNPLATIDDGSCECPPANDDCADAVAIGCGVTVSGSTIFANDDSAVAGSCLGIEITSPGVWYTLIGDGSQFNLSTCASAVDTKINVYAGNCNNLTCVAANDDDPACAGFASTVNFTSLPGIQYYVLVSEFGLGVGIDFELVVECIDCTGQSPINDQCSSALPLPDGAQLSGSLCCTNADDISEVNAFASGYGVWYAMNSGNFDTFDFNLTNVSGGNVGLIVYSSASGNCSTLDLVALCGPVAGQCAGDLYAANIPVTQNTQYYFLVYTTQPGACGEYTFSADLTGVGCTDPFASNYEPINTIEDGTCTYDGPPINDLCADAFPLVCGVPSSGTTALSTATGSTTACGISNGDNGVWYSYAGDGQVVTLSTCGSVIDSRIEVFSSNNGCAGPFTCVIGEDNDASDDGCGFFDGDDADVQFVSQVGVTYYIYISAGSVDTNGDFQDDLFDGGFVIDVQCAPLTPGCQDDCACNYNPAANQDDGSCDYFSCVTCAEGTPFMFDMQDSYGDGWNGNTYTITDLEGNVIAEGSLDDAQCSTDNDNFVGPEFGFDVFCLADGCYEIEVGGGFFLLEISWTLMDSQGNVVLAGEAETTSFTIGAGLCGCTDPGACNYDPLATDDDNSCEYNSCAGCTDVTACNFNPAATISNPASCCFENCLTFLMNDQAGDGWNGNTAVITDAGTGDILGTATLANGASGIATFCAGSGCYTITVGGGTWMNEVSWTLLGTNSGVVTGGAGGAAQQFSIGDSNCSPGCTEPFACNYDPEAGLSDCTLCEYTSCQGCTYSQADNYDPAAIIDDGSCIITALSSCPEDLNQDGLVGVADLLQLLGAFGTTCPE